MKIKNICALLILLRATPLIAAENSFLKELSQKSGFIAKVRVEKVEYKLSEPDAFPLTFFTLKPEKIYKGESDETITVRSFGGVKEARIIKSSNAILFNEGDVEYIFIPKKMEKMTAKIAISKGDRFKVYDQKVYDDNGKKIIEKGQDDDS